MAGQIKPIPQHDYSGGANPVASPSLLGPKQSQRITNMILDEHGMLRTVPGTLITSTAPVSEAGSRIVLPIVWNPLISPSQQLVIINPISGAATFNELYNRATTPWTLLGAFNSNFPIPSYSVLGDIMLITDDYQVPKIWDGAVFQNLTNTATVPPRGGKYTCTHEGFMYLWNTRASSDLTYGGDGPSALRQSDINAPGTWNNAQVVFIDKDDGYQGQGMAAFTVAESGIAPFDTLILFKDTATYQMTGNLGTGGGAPSSNFSLQRAKTDMGCYAPKSIQFCAGFGVIRLSHRGFALFDGVEDRLISEEIRPYLFGRDDITSLDWNNILYSWGSQVTNPPLYICFCPISGQILTRAFVYDLVRRSWTIVDLPFPVASVNLLTKPDTIPQVLLGDSPPPGTVGNIRRWFAGDLTWDGVDITNTVRSRLGFDASPLERAYWRRLNMEVIADTSPVTVSTVVQCSNGLTRSSLYTLGSSPTPITGFPFELETGIDVTCNSVYYDMTGVGAMRLVGHEFHMRKKPLIGASNYIGRRG